MTCEEALVLISAKIDNELTAAEEAQLQAHLDGCEHCRSVLAAMTGLEHGLAGLEEPAPEGLKRGVLYRIGQESGKVKKPKKRLFGPGTGFGLVAAVLVLLVGTGVIPLRSLLSNRSGANDTQGVYENEKNAPRETGAPAEGVDHLIEPDRHDNSGGQSKSPIVSPETNQEPAEYPTSDSYYLGGRESEYGSVSDNAKPIDDGIRAACSRLSRENGALMVYTEFDYDSLLELLNEYEPELGKRLESVKAETADSSPVDGYLLCRTDFRTMMALHEWLLANLPQSEEMPSDLKEAETSLMMRMEELDPGSECLYSIITWSVSAKRISWPAGWPVGWAARLRTGENWELFFPSEDYAPKQSDPVLLLFPRAD